MPSHSPAAEIRCRGARSSTFSAILRSTAGVDALGCALHLRARACARRCARAAARRARACRRARAARVRRARSAAARCRSVSKPCAVADLVRGDQVDALSSRASRAHGARRRSVSAAKPTMNGRRGSAATSARMSGFCTSSSSSGAPSCFLIFCCAIDCGRKSPTAAAEMKTSLVGRARQHRVAHLARAAHVDALDAARRRERDRPAISVTSAPCAAAAAAIAKPMRPELRLPMKRTGSMSSNVGPALISILHARRARAARASRRARRRCSRLRAGAPRRIRRRPGCPDAGPSTRTPRSRSIARFACVAAFAHICWFIAGASAIGAAVARQSVVSRSFARPCASRAIRSADAGAMTT